MSDAASRLYPSANPTLAAPAPQTAPAPQAAAPAQPAAADPEQAAQTAPASPPGTQHWGERPPALPEQDASVPPPPEPLTGTDLLYDAPLRSAQDVAAVMQLPDSPDAAGFDVTPEAVAERQEAAATLANEGLSRAEITQAWQFAVMAAHPQFKAPSVEAADAALRRHFGARYNDQMAAARAFYQGIAARSPAIARHVTANGLDRSPEFIIALAKAASKRRAR